MIKRNTSLKLILIFDAIIFLLCIISIYHISEKAALPFNIEQREDGLYISDSLSESSVIQINDKLIGVLFYPAEYVEEVECVLDGNRINEKVGLTLQSEDGVYQIELHTIPFYSLQYLLIASFVSLCFFVIGIFVLIKRPELKSARLFHAGSISTGIIIATTWGNYNIEPLGLGYLIRIIFSGAYSFAPLFFISFVLSLRERKRKIYKYIRPLLYIVSLGFFLLQSASFLYFINKETFLSLQIYLIIFSVFRVYLLCYIVIGFSIFIYTYKTAAEEYERKKLRWILFGFSVGLFGLIVLWILPYLLTGEGLVPEVVLLLMILFIPITFAISIVRYRLLNIDLIIERSIVYGMVILFLLSTYYIVIEKIRSVLGIHDNTIPSIITAVLVALFFQPLYLRVQSVVNKRFFKVRYNFREALRIFLNEIKQINEIQSLATSIVSKTNKLIPTRKIGFFSFKKSEHKLHLIAHIGFDILNNRSVKFNEENLETDLSLPIVLQNKIEVGAEVEVTDTTVFGRWGINVAFPIKSESGVLHGFLVLGEKKPNTKFTIEDLDLLSTIASRAAAIIERIKLQEELIREHLEAERLEELNELKSLFVSTVSHDLKTPLTSIKLFSEILQNKKDIPENKRKEYLRIIEGESDRLTRLINNVLDFTKIEKGIKEYKFEEVSLNGIVNEVLLMMEYQFRIEKFELHKFLTVNEKFINGDKDAIAEALINLLSNAIKYSDEERSISVSTLYTDQYYCISVEDHGIGIKESELANIITPYFRSEDKLVKSESGVGLGLAIVKHIMNAHHGKINITSTWQEGSTLTLCFPVGEKNEKNINN